MEVCIKCWSKNTTANVGSRTVVVVTRSRIVTTVVWGHRPAPFPPCVAASDPAPLPSVDATNRRRHLGFCSAGDGHSPSRHARARRKPTRGRARTPPSRRDSRLRTRQGMAHGQRAGTHLPGRRGTASGSGCAGAQLRTVGARARTWRPMSGRKRAKRDSGWNAARSGGKTSRGVHQRGEGCRPSIVKHRPGTLTNGVGTESDGGGRK
jgi:hypothetical protein